VPAAAVVDESDDDFDIIASQERTQSLHYDPVQEKAVPVSCHLAAPLTQRVKRGWGGWS
jgi:hypothetical protein